MTGVQTCALPISTNITELWNGYTWTEVNDMNTARQSLASVGHTSTAALAVAGGTPPVTNNLNANNESWNGTNWTEVNDVNTARRSLAGIGTSTAGIVVGGVAAPPEATGVRTELWNGTNWTEENE